MLIKVSDYIANFLVENGITNVFTVTGGNAMHLNDSFGHHKDIKCIYNHHEQASSIAIEGYARVNNEIAVACVTSGPGGTNALTGVLSGYLDSIPMLIISGQVKLEMTAWASKVKLRQLGEQEFNISETVKNMTKYAVMITDKNTISYHLEKAIFLAKEGRPGPVWIDIPVDIQGASIETDDLVHYDKKEDEKLYDISDNDIQKIIEKIKSSKRPVVQLIWFKKRIY